MSKDSIVQFRRQILQSPEHIRTLWNIQDRYRLVEQCIRIGESMGCDLSPSGVQEAMRENNATPFEYTHSENGLPEKEWIPHRIVWKDNRPVVDWCYIGSHHFDRPFFEDSIRSLNSQPFNRLFRFQTPIDIFDRLASMQPAIKPSGFIFHLSRCGSSLISLLLSSLSQCIVLSEASPLDSILRMRFQDPSITEERTAIWLQGALNQMGQPRLPDERYLFIKFDSWHIMAMPFLLGLFPDVPYILIYRSPVEIMMSHRRAVGYQMVPGMIEPEWFQWKPSDLLSISQSEYCARVLGRLSQFALQYHRSDRGLLVHYSQLPDFVWTILLEYFHIECSEEQIQNMHHWARFEAKHPGIVYQPNTSERKDPPPKELIFLAKKWIEQEYYEMDKMRNQKK